MNSANELMNRQHLFDQEKLRDREVRVHVCACGDVCLRVCARACVVERGRGGREEEWGGEVRREGRERA